MDIPCNGDRCGTRLFISRYFQCNGRFVRRHSKAKRFHHNFPDPAKATGTDEEINEQFREVGQQIKEYCERFIAENLKGNQ